MLKHAIVLFLCIGSGSAFAGSGVVPGSWYELPEDKPLQLQEIDPPKDPKKRLEMLARLVDNIYEANTQSLDGTPMLSAPAASGPVRPKDLVPWHLEFLRTDLAVSASGLLGVLTLKGTPGVSAIWRRQNSSTGPKPVPVGASPSEGRRADLVDAGSLGIDSETTVPEIASQLEPAIRAMVASGKITNEPLLRKNLNELAREFQGLVEGLENDPGFQWWVSRFRLEVSIEASGKVSLVTAGGDLRFRFDWHRIERKGATRKPGIRLTATKSKLKRNLEEFARATAADLEAIEAGELGKHGFKAYQFRVGLGFTAKGDVGIAKAGAAISGHLYFARDVKKPVVHPPAVGFVNVVEPSDAPIRHQRFAAANGIAFESDEANVVFRVPRKKFRQGLISAAKLGSFFASRSNKSNGRHWKIFEIRTSFDVSLTGTLPIATIGGLAATQIAFYNQNF